MVRGEEKKRRRRRRLSDSLYPGAFSDVIRCQLARTGIYFKRALASLSPPSVNDARRIDARSVTRVNPAPREQESDH